MFEMNIRLEGLTCPACKKIAEKRIGAIKGVVSVMVNLETGEAKINAENELSLNIIKESLKDTPYSIIS